MNISPAHWRPISIDLFAGAGGLSLGFEQAGFDIAAAVEIDPIHCAIHEYNFPDCTTICASVTELSGKDIRQQAMLGSVDIDCVFGGAPCQGFSMIGKRILDDPRNQLVFHYVRLVRELQPKYCVFENVKGLTIGQHRQFLAELIETLTKAGYDIRLPYQVLDAADYGVPQHRQRLFLVGARRGQALPDYPAPHGAATVADAIDDLPDADEFPELLKSDSVPAQYSSSSRYARRLRGLEQDPEDYSYPRIYDSGILTASLRTRHTALSKQRFLKTPPGATEPISRFHRLNPTGLSNTLRAGTDSARGAFTSARPIHPHLPRVITVREAARLHSYPDWFRFHVTKWHGFRQIGNSVPPLLGRAIAGELIKSLAVRPEQPTKIMRVSRQDVRLLSFNMAQAAAYYRVRFDTIAQRTRKAPEKDDNQAEMSFA